MRGAARPVRVVVVDDSATMRALVRRALAADPGIEVAGEAADAPAAREVIRALDPDVVTLDIEMPGMDGLQFLDRIMRLRPMPVIMVSSHAGADATMRALEAGAVDVVAKPTPERPRSLDALPEAVRAAAAVDRRHLAARAAPAASAPDVPRAVAAARARSRVRLIAIAASTGGVEALVRLFRALPPGCPPLAIVQHMPALFTGSFARRLASASGLAVREAEEGLPLLPGTAVVAPGSERHLEVAAGPAGGLVCRLVEGPLVSGHRPSGDRLLAAAAAAAGARAVGLVLTGMGADGAQGLLAMRRAGAHTIVQDRASSVVWGMPGAAHRLGAACEEVPLDRIPDALARALHPPPDAPARPATAGRDHYGDR